MRKGVILGLFAFLLCCPSAFAVGISYDPVDQYATERSDHKINVRDFLRDIEPKREVAFNFNFGDFFSRLSDNRHGGFRIADGARYIHGIRRGGLDAGGSSQTPAPVPEPATVLLLVTGLATMAVFARKSRRS